jgi:Concanavalin A-like lectin/glucanases superfamily
MRRRVLAALALALGLAGAAPAAAHASSYADAVAATPGLAGWWRLGEASGTQAADETGGAPGSLTAVTLGTAGAIDGDADMAARFNGAGSANLGDGPAFAGAMSVEAWVDPDGARATQYVLSDGGTSGGYHLVLGSDGAPAFQVVLPGGTVQARGPALIAGAWHHLVGTVAAGTVRLYVDGELAATTTASGTPVPSSDRLRLGRLSSSSRSYLRGTLDEVAVYGAALPASTVRAHYALAADTRMPDTAVAAGPAATIAAAEATFTFGGDAVADGYQCRLDAAAWSACASPVTLRSLADGAHSFAVRAVSRYGVADATAAAYAWRVDTTAPETRALAILPSAAQPVGSVTFAASEGASYQCRRATGPWSACATPLAAGAGAALSVRAIDAAGNADPSPAAIPLPAPAAARAAVSQLTGPTATFSVAGAGTGRLECSVDGAAWAACAGQVTTGALAPGVHGVSVRATSAGAPAPPRVAWSVALPAPRLVGFQFPVLLSVPPARKIRAARFPQSRLPALRFSLNVASTVRLTLVRTAGGRTRRVKAWAVAGATGANVVRLPLATYRTLRSGRHRLTAQAAGPGRPLGRRVRALPRRAPRALSGAQTLTSRPVANISARPARMPPTAPGCRVRPSSSRSVGASWTMT